MKIVFAILSLPLICAFLSCVFQKFATLRSIIILFISTIAAILSFKLSLSGPAFFSQTIFDPLSINIEPLSCIFLCLTSFLWAVTNLYSWSYLNTNPNVNATKLHFFTSLSMFCTFGIAVSGNLLTTFIFYELLTFFTYPLIPSFGGKHQGASSKYVIILLATSLTLFLPAVLFIENIVGHTTFTIGGILDSANINAPVLLLMIFLYGVAKTAIVPVHSWLPDAMIAPMPVTAMLHAVAVVKSGVFIILKIIIYIFGVAYLQKTVAGKPNVITILCACVGCCCFANSPKTN